MNHVPEADRTPDGPAYEGRLLARPDDELVDQGAGFDAKTLVTHPATTTHASMEPEARAAVGIGDNVVRLSVGLEFAGDLIEDLRRGLG